VREGLSASRGEGGQDQHKGGSKRKREGWCKLADVIRKQWNS